jgi:hypothetical protein
VHFQPQVAGLRAPRRRLSRLPQYPQRPQSGGCEAVIMEAKVVPSGVAEIGKLQAKEGFVYLKP